jgi:hypothetical protein
MTWNARLAKAVAATLVALLFAAPGAFLLAFTLQLDWDAFQRHLVVPFYFVDQPNKLARCSCSRCSSRSGRGAGRRARPAAPPCASGSRWP